MHKMNHQETPVGLAVLFSDSDGKSASIKGSSIMEYGEANLCVFSRTNSLVYRHVEEREKEKDGEYHALTNFCV